LNEVIRVGLAELKVSKNSTVLTCAGLGSCVAVIMHDPVAKVGGIAHVMLPGRAPEVRAETAGKYAFTAVELLLAKMESAGASRDRIKCKIVGGSRMFRIETDLAGKIPGGYPRSVSIGERNVQAVKTSIQEAGLEIVAEDTGGSHGRSIRFYVNSGKVEITSIMVGSTEI